MADETSDRPARPPKGRGHHGGSPGEQSPLQTRAAFLKNRDWESVVRFNQGACERGRAQHGKNPESFEKIRQEWEEQRALTTSLAETIDFLRRCHRQAPFLFFNGNTFADIGRALTDLLFAELP